MTKKIAVIGGGLSGLTVAHLLKDRFDVKVFEKESRPGGLIKCERHQGSLFHICGGHVFNTKREDVLTWFWNFFDRDREFTKANRNAVICMENGIKIPYPIENHAYHLEDILLKSFIKDLVQIAQNHNTNVTNFEEFLKANFGETLYKIYFEPYNKKIWRCDLKTIPISWLDGKLPMPSITEMLYNNISHIKEETFVHSSFWYEKMNGSQFIIDRLLTGLNIICNCSINEIIRDENSWLIEGERFDKVFFCGIIKDIPSILKGVDITSFEQHIEKLDYHGTTSVFCETEMNPYSWIYLPSKLYNSHRIICTGNFAESNKANGKMTATIEFTDFLSKEEILVNLEKMPLKPKYITHHFNKFTYPIQDFSTRQMIGDLKKQLSTNNFYLAGRFAVWEYYNMDAVIGDAIDLCKTIK